MGNQHVKLTVDASLFKPTMGFSAGSMSATVDPSGEFELLVEAYNAEQNWRVSKKVSVKLASSGGFGISLRDGLFHEVRAEASVETVLPTSKHMAPLDFVTLAVQCVGVEVRLTMQVMVKNHPILPAIPVGVVAFTGKLDFPNLSTQPQPDGDIRVSGALVLSGRISVSLFGHSRL
ncbi:unnamed protein product [Symbiodinium natans]|uniref:Uncharacterized protein n=1 Tax=Symbiodinium natans TaxID=878477 RepID=A0A812N8R1_9DINO|nr:unnamed protein product [Symbiodinium natans]